MTSFELIEKLRALGDLKLLIRGENVIADIGAVYRDHDHSDDSPFISIDLENES